MRKILLLSFLLGLLTTPSLSQTDNSYQNHLLSIPFYDLFYTIDAYKISHGKYPDSFHFLENITEDQWYETCYVTGFKGDSLFVPRVDYFSPVKTKLSVLNNRLRVDFSFKKAEYQEEVEELIHSPLFEKDFRFHYEVSISIKGGSGSMLFSKNDKKKTKVIIDDFEAVIVPVEYHGILTEEDVEAPIKRIDIKSQKEFYLYKDEDRVCIEKPDIIR